MKKRLFGILLSFAMVLTMMPALSQTAYATDGSLVGTIIKEGETLALDNDYIEYAPGQTASGTTSYTLSGWTYDNDNKAWSFTFSNIPAEFLIPGDETPRPDGFEVYDGNGSENSPYKLRLYHEYPIWVGGTRVTSANMSGDGWSYTPATTGEDPTPATLTLDGYISTGGEYKNAVIYAEENLTIELKGNNKITGYCGIMTVDAKGVTITGEGFLEVTGTRHCGIKSDNYIEIRSGTVTAEGIYYAFFPSARTGSDMIVKAGESKEDAKPVDHYFYQKWAKIGNPAIRNVRFKVVNGAWNDGGKADKTVSLEGFKDETVLTSDKIPAVGGRPDTGYKAGSWDVTPAAGTLITEDKTYTYTYAPAPSKKTARTVLVTKAISAGNTKAKVSWNNAGADRYVVYYGVCGKSLKKYKTVNGKTRSVTVSRLRRGGMYKFRIVAQKKSGKSYRNIAVSGYAHMAAGNVCGRYTNVKDLKVNRKAVNLARGRSFTVKTSLSKVRKNKRLFNLSHDPAVRYITDDPGVAVVNSKGKITAKGKGTCYVYVQAVNGIWKTVKVTVK